MVYKLLLGAVLCLPLAACEQPALTWADAAPERTANPSPLAHPPFVPYDSTLRAAAPYADFLETQDRLREAGAASLLFARLGAMAEATQTLTSAATIPSTATGQATDAPLGDGAAPMDSLRCARSLRIVTAAGKDPKQGHGQVAAWWTRADGGRVFLMAAWRDSVPGQPMSATWRGPIPVDTLDQGPRDAQASDRGAYGCARPAPSLSVDSINGYVHVAYALTGPEGPGIFYAHQMTPHALFEPPVAVLYGARLGEVRVASDGDLVAVTYEDPNGRARGRIGLAVSRTAGHIFEERQTVSVGSTESRDPYVAVRGRGVIVGWSEFATPTAEPTFLVRRARIH
jgi:hypothetical protein